MVSENMIRARSYCVILMPKLLNEFIGTFFLVLVGCIARTLKFECVRLSSSMAIGSMLMVVVFMGGHISGGHYNPAVTFGVCCSGCKRGYVGPLDSVCYIFIQLLASLCAAACQLAITLDTIGIQRADRITVGGALLVEALFTFILVTVVLHVATTSELEQNSFYGTAIGFTVISGAICVGQISGGVFNPAIVFGPSIVNAASSSPYPQADSWLYYVGCIVGALVAALLFRVTNWSKAYGEKFTKRVEGMGVQPVDADVHMNNRIPGVDPVTETPKSLMNNRNAGDPNTPLHNHTKNNINNNNYCACCGRGCPCPTDFNNNNTNNNNNNTNAHFDNQNGDSNVQLVNYKHSDHSNQHSRSDSEQEEGSNRQLLAPSLLSPRMRSIEIRKPA